MSFLYWEAFGGKNLGVDVNANGENLVFLSMKYEH